FNDVVGGVAGLVVIALGAAAPEAGFVALVLGADRKEAAVGVAGVDHDRLVVFSAQVPDGIEPRVVGLDVAAIPTLGGESEFLGDVQSGGAGAETALQLGGGFFGPAGLVDAFVVQTGEMDDAVAVGLADLHILVEGLAEAAVHVADHAEAGLVHELDELLV